MKKIIQIWNKNPLLWDIKSYEFFWIGEYLIADILPIREPIIKKHIERTDEKLSKLILNSTEFRSVLKRRFLTFEEYMIFNTAGKIPKQHNHINEYNQQYWQLLQKSTLKSLLYTDTEHDKNYLELLQRCLPETKNFFFSPNPVPIPRAALEKHLIITGKTGSGKSQMIQSIFYQLQEQTQSKQEASLILIDPHGDISEKLLSLRINLKKPERIWYIDPQWSSKNAPCINPFWKKIHDPILVDLLSQQWAKAFSELIPEAGMSLQMETLLKPCLSVLFQKGECGLIDLQNFMDDTQNEIWVEQGKKSKNPVFRSFFEQAFLNKKYALTKLAIYTRLQHLMNNFAFYKMMNGKSSIDFKKGMQDGKVILINLSKGKLGEDTSRALGKFITATLLSIALQRAFEGEKNRKSCFLFVDEFHNLASSSMETIFSEARKYKLHLIVGTQTIGQLPLSLKDMVINNTAVKLVGMNGLPALKSQAGDIGVPYAELQNLPPYHFYLKYDHHPALKIKSPDFLLKNHKLYFALPNELKKIKDFCLYDSGIYNSIALHSENKIQNYPKVENEKLQNPSSTNDFKPKFGL